MSFWDNFRTGDRVRGQRVVYDEYKTYEGTVTGVKKIGYKEGDGTPGETGYLDIREDTGHDNWVSDDIKLISRAPEPQLPRNAVGWCHYCGQPAYGWGFFDEPACGQCGGK